LLEEDMKYFAPLEKKNKATGSGRIHLEMLKHGAQN
jgi:hypothetical protein